MLTHDCNLGCSYCYTGRKFRREMTDDVAARALDLALGSAPPGARVELSYFGGEPLLAWDLLARTAAKARALAEARGVRLEQSVTTNGTLLDAARVERLAALGVYVGLSIDGVREAHERNRPTMGDRSSWAETLRGLELLVAAGRPFETVSVVTPASAPLFGASVAELFARGVPRVGVNPCFEADWTEADLAAWEAGLLEVVGCVAGHLRSGREVSFPPFDEKIRAWLAGGLPAGAGCSLGERFVAVSPEGHLYPCERLVGEDDDPTRRIGHVETGLARAAVTAIRCEMPDHHATNDDCGTCAARDLCGARCACANQAETGSLGRAGGVQCWWERTTAALGEALARALLAEGPAFRRWFGVEGRFEPPPPRPAPNEIRLAARPRRLPLAQG